MSSQQATANLAGAREAVDLYPDAPHLGQQLQALERALEEQSPLVFDLAKSLVEAICRTILTDRGVSFSSKTDAPELLRETQAVLPLVPAGSDVDRDSVRKTLAGLVTCMHGICELRNAEGLASHGKDAFKEHRALSQAQLAARAASAIVSFLAAVHRGDKTLVGKQRIYLEDYPEFNAYIDGAVGDIQILDYSYQASASLFALDESAYREQLGLYEEDGE